VTATPPTPLQVSIETLYRVFGRYPYRLTEASKDPCFPGSCDDIGLKGVPLRKITIEGINPYLWKAITTWGGSNDFKHFLPRILELVAETHGCVPGVNPDHLGCLDPDFDLVCSKLAYAQWQTWPSKEQDAVSGFLSEFWKTLVMTGAMTPDDWSNIDGFFDDALQPLMSLTLTGTSITHYYPGT